MNKTIFIFIILLPLFSGILFSEIRIWCSVCFAILSVVFIAKPVQFHITVIRNLKVLNLGAIISGSMFFYVFLSINGYASNNILFTSSVLLCCFSLFRIKNTSS